MPAFASLSEQKRGSQDSATRRASMSDQQPKAGLFGQFFHKYVTIVMSWSHTRNSYTDNGFTATLARTPKNNENES